MPVASIVSISEDKIAFQWFTEEGKRRHESNLLWRDVNCVTTFKRDMFAYDLACIRIDSSTQESVEFDEEDPHWPELTSSLPLHLPGCRAWGDWFSEVAFPAFEANERILYRRREE